MGAAPSVGAGLLPLFKGVPETTRGMGYMARESVARKGKQ
jgi:hypothetical protein